VLQLVSGLTNAFYVNVKFQGSIVLHGQLFVDQSLGDGRARVDRADIVDRRDGGNKFVQTFQFPEGPPADAVHTAVFF
jgi:hypothetical protein